MWSGLQRIVASQKIEISANMIRIASIRPGTVIFDGLQSSRRSKFLSTLPTATRHFSSATKDDEKPKGIPYSKLTVGVPKECFPLEKRVAATPEVSEIIDHASFALRSHKVDFIHISIGSTLLVHHISLSPN